MAHFHFTLSSKAHQLQNWMFIFHGEAFGLTFKGPSISMVTALVHVKQLVGSQLGISKLSPLVGFHI